MELNGYALVDSEQRGFSWHPTYQDAVTRRDWESIYGRPGLKIVKDVEATWPDEDYDEAVCRVLQEGS